MTSSRPVRGPIVRRLGVVILAIWLGVLVACGDDADTTGDQDPAHQANGLPFEERDPAAIASALKAAGLKICNDLHLPIPNESYKYEETRRLSLTTTEGACHTSISDMEAEPSHGFLSLEWFTSAELRDEGLEVHKNELVTGTQRGDYNPAKIIWVYGQYLVVLSNSTTTDVEAAVFQAMAAVEGARHAYDSPRAQPR